jgi:hypothetical protein
MEDCDIHAFFGTPQFAGAGYGNSAMEGPTVGMCTMALATKVGV